ncbi:ribose 5-phosphate isomerase B [Alkalibacter saccharofermentans]|uniref:Ribose-5-phosphate isomerase n=1 Tax=Alkalibacter saccharofermentans DSM 14828 TaxID=1120975 RepID=A0A1M4Y393_9FIRM|nr:ribose 5-phosphate isomerase B [Alkalibacter saccharofermentans]SHF00043.1 ribose-5-phosphate isomerase [Alkalibacter saccharofermentans DSM 14828]
MKIALGSDHGGFHLKEVIKEYLKDKNYEIEDFGAYDTSSIDYPEIGEKVAIAVKDSVADKGIIVCGTGLGISISANKVPGIRAALVSDTFSAKMSRAHNDANILALGGRVLGDDLALEIVEAWLNTEFEGGRHGIRVDKIKDLENKYNK